MELVSIREFLSITQLRPDDLLGMLERGELRFAEGEHRELSIDISSLSPEVVAARGLVEGGDGGNPDTSLLEELVAAEALAVMDDIITEAVALAGRWMSEAPPDLPPDSDTEQ